LSNVVQSCNSAGRHSAVVAAAQWLQRDSVGLAAVRSQHQDAFMLNTCSDFGMFLICSAEAVGSGRASSNTYAKIQEEL